MKRIENIEERDTEVGAANVTPTDPFDEGEQTQIRPDHHHHKDLEDPGEELEPEEIEETQETSERSEVGVREELLFKGTSKSKTISSEAGQECDDVEHKSERRATKVKNEKKLRNDGLSSGYDGPGLMHSGIDFTPSPRQEKSKKALSDSSTRPMSDGITMGVSSTYDMLMMSMGKKKGGASSSTRLQPQLTSSSLGLTQCWERLAT